MKIFLCCIVFLITSCNSVFGTDHGNPFNQNPGAGNGSAPIYSSELVKKFCVQVHSCFSNVTFISCQNELNSNTLVTAELNITTYNTLSSVKDAEVAQLLNVNSTNFDQCSQAIINNSCNDQIVFDPDLSSGILQGLYKVFRTSISCQQIFSVKN